MNPGQEVLLDCVKSGDIKVIRNAHKISQVVSTGRGGLFIKSLNVADSFPDKDIRNEFAKTYNLRGDFVVTHPALILERLGENAERILESAQPVNVDELGPVGLQKLMSLITNGDLKVTRTQEGDIDKIILTTKGANLIRSFNINITDAGAALPASALPGNLFVARPEDVATMGNEALAAISKAGVVSFASRYGSPREQYKTLSI